MIMNLLSIVTAIISETAQYRLFRPVSSDLLSKDAKTHVIKLNFINKSVTETVPTYFKEKETPIISYSYTKSVASKIFNSSSTL